MLCAWLTTSVSSQPSMPSWLATIATVSIDLDRPLGACNARSTNPALVTRMAPDLGAALATPCREVTRLRPPRYSTRTRLGRRCPGRRGDPPQPQRLVNRPRDEGLAVRCIRHAQDAVRVPLEGVQQAAVGHPPQPHRPVVRRRGERLAVRRERHA